MRDRETNCPTDIAKLETRPPDELSSADFDATRIFADPVTYLAGFGIGSELTEIQHSGFPAAA